MDILTLTNQNFEEEVLNSQVPVLVDFWASWCMPCKMMLPIIDEVFKESNGTFKVGKVNVDEEPSLATRYGVMSIPTFIVFKDGKLSNMLVGMQDKEKIFDLLK